MSHEPSQYDLAQHESPRVDQWLERLTSVQRVMGSIGDLPESFTLLFSVAN